VKYKVVVAPPSRGLLGGEEGKGGVADRPRPSELVVVVRGRGALGGVETLLSALSARETERDTAAANERDGADEPEAGERRRFDGGDGAAAPGGHLADGFG